MKLDRDGNFKWVRSFGTTNTLEIGRFVQETSDGGFIIIAYRNDGDGQAYVVKTDSQGNEEWIRKFGKRKWTYANSGQQTSDGGYIITGSSSEFLDIPLLYQLFLLKIDDSGNIEWRTLFPKENPVEDQGISVQQTRDGGYIVGAHGKVGLIKFDSNGNIEWHRKNQPYNKTHIVQQTKDDGYILSYDSSPWSNTNETKYWQGQGGLIKYDSKGNEVWNKPSKYALELTSIKQTPDKGYIMTGTELKFSILRKTDSLGNEEWIRYLTGDTIGFPTVHDKLLKRGGYYPNCYADHYGTSIHQAKDGGHLVLVSNGHYNFKSHTHYITSYLIKTNSKGITTEFSHSNRESFAKSLVDFISDDFSYPRRSYFQARGYKDWIPKKEVSRIKEVSKIKEDRSALKNISSYMYKALKSAVKCYCYLFLFLYIVTPS